MTHTVAALDPRTWWFTARATGIVAWVLLASAVIWGLMLSCKTFGRAASPAWMLDLHRYIGGLAVVFTGLHLAGLAADDYVAFGWRELFVPLASTWKPGAVAWGIASFYLLLAVELTSLLQRWMSRRWWRRVHTLSFPLFVLATVHLLTAGTDAGNPLLQLSLVVVSTVVGFLAIVRIAVARGAALVPGVGPVLDAGATAAAAADDSRAAMLARARAGAPRPRSPRMHGEPPTTFSPEASSPRAWPGPPTSADRLRLLGVAAAEPERQVHLDEADDRTDDDADEGVAPEADEERLVLDGVVHEVLDDVLEPDRHRHEQEHQPEVGPHEAGRAQERTERAPVLDRDARADEAEEREREDAGDEEERQSDRP